MPGYRTGAYGILLALLQLRDLYQQQYATKEEIIRRAQEHCDSSFDTPEPGKSYTAWAGMKTLEKKEYVWKQGSPAKYMLTDTGLNIAENLQSTANGEPARPLLTTQEPPEPPEELEWNDTQEEEPEVDLSLYVLNPDRFRASSSSSSNPSTTTDPAITTTTASAPPAPAPSSRAASSALSTATPQPIEIEDDDEDQEDVDLSLYFLEPEKHATASHEARSTLTSPSYASAPHIKHPTPTTQDEIDLVLSQSSQPADMVWEGPPPRNEPDTPFPFTYLDTHGNPVKHVAQANVQIKGRIQHGYDGYCKR